MTAKLADRRSCVEAHYGDAVGNPLADHQEALDTQTSDAAG